MADVYELYIDDSGTRALDHIQPKTGGEHAWFGLGGLFFKKERKQEIEAAHAAFYERWKDCLKADAPLHSNDIRMSKGPFSFLALDKERRKKFLDDLGAVMTSLPVVAHACVIDRAGYRLRYSSKYSPEEKWLYCKTAFAVLVERATKIARSKGARLRISVERTDPVTDANIRAYYDALTSSGMPFAETSAKYKPLAAADFAAAFYGLDMKSKTSPTMQFADLFLWPLCKAGYSDHPTYQAMKNAGKIIDSVIGADQLDELGVKYSCFDHATPFARTVPPPKEEKA